MNKSIIIFEFKFKLKDSKKSSPFKIGSWWISWQIRILNLWNQTRQQTKWFQKQQHDEAQWVNRRRRALIWWWLNNRCRQSIVRGRLTSLKLSQKRPWLPLSHCIQQNGGTFPKPKNSRIEWTEEKSQMLIKIDVFYSVKLLAKNINLLI